MTERREHRDPDAKKPLPPSPGVDHLLSGFAAIAENAGLEKVLESVLESACQVSGARYGALGVVGNDDRLSHFITVGLTPEQVTKIGKLPVGHGVLGLLISEPKPLRLQDLREHPAAAGFPQHHPQMTSFLGVPIKVRNTVFGNLYLTEKSGADDFTQDDQDLVVALAAAAGVAIENMRLFENETHRSRWLESGQQAARALLDDSQETHRSDVEIVADHAFSASEANAVMVLTQLSSDDQLYCEVALGRDLESLQGAHLGSGSALHRFTSGFGGTSILTGDGLDAVFPAPKRELFGATLCTRITSRGNHARFLVIARSRQDTSFSQLDQDMVSTFAAHVSLALELIQLHAQREQEAVFGDRDRIARDLHDLVIQRVFAAGLSIQSLRRSVVGAEPLARIASVTAELDATIKDLRDTIYSLHAAAPGRPALSSRILALVRATCEGTDIRQSIQFSGPIDTAVDSITSREGKAVIREALANILRHADASSLSVEVMVRATEVEFRITDDGCGFAAISHRSGLANMRRRTENFGGTFSIESTLGAGTCVAAILPLRT
ncbi:GAF domain-containing sensor histidine kinase [Pseudarthrobacter sp. PS3-L1]|uniref:GAF domain-containing sensor histidine kinase n=1 Tax=Pseudarthrobacter sp. PS3-L1 TaxID=3046207 RepID=UPI0024B96396|nr:GAF domain-containing sensor histidine kinase [Pseudarthrobacter sp. PS3-L1]MDJ0320903.1 GAF domain-containing protein [Pseudarthrobacter sp. PS3-L1]